MTDKNWKDKLRQQMSEYTETPPEGLWEALEKAGAVGGKKAAGAGLFARLFGGRAPMWWALAGVAAAAALVLFVTRPATSPVAPASDITADVSSTVPQDSDVPDVLSEPGTADDSTAGIPAGAAAPAAATTPVSSPRRQIRHNLLAGGEAPADGERNDTAVAAEDAAQTQEQSPAQEQAPVQEQVPVQETVPSQPGTDGPRIPSGQSGEGRTVLPVKRSAGRDRPLLAASLIGGGMPGSYTSASTVDYGFRSSDVKMAASPRQASVLSRNRITETNVIRKMDFQAGLLVSFDVTRHWGLESGIQYTRLSSSITSTTGSISTTTDETIGYIGIPLRVIYTPLQLRLLSAYISAGPEVEYGISRKWNLYDVISSEISARDGGTDIPGDWVLSASVNAGVQIHPTRHGAFFVQPGVVFRHVWDTTLESYYTDHPVSFRLAAGYRITF